jgi:hypothetical protein
LIIAIKVGLCEFMILDLGGTKDINAKIALIVVYKPRMLNYFQYRVGSFGIKRIFANCLGTRS